ncbi:hypothetical protein AURDEDRAFT_166591 [Auricularia subglabra TFB-10046 SS5]|nr:hypothetical protein AURDEDRAFT_166591 [Auricularia subglabra TFB-10046 SS5]
MYVQPWQNEHTFYFIFTEDSVLRVPRLPIDVLKALMKRIPQEELRILSSACREFRKMAHDAGLSLHRTVSNAAGLATFAQVIDYAESTPTPLNLALTVDYSPSYNAIPPPVMWDTLLVITCALPLLTRLSIMASRTFIESVLMVLNAPAPRLHSLEIVQWEVFGRYATILPHNLLSPSNGLYTSLRSVTLDFSHLDSHSPVPAFNTVTSAHVTLGAQQSRIAVALLFPAVKELHLRIGEAWDKVIIDISNLSLHLLTIDSAWHREVEFSCSRQARAPQVSVVEYTGNCVPRHELFWPADGREITAHLRQVTRNGYPYTALTLADISWRSTFYLPNNVTSRWHVGNPMLEPLQTCRLVALTVDDALLETLIQTPIDLSQLRELFIHIYAPLRPNLLRSRRGGVSRDTERYVLCVALAGYCALVVSIPWKRPYSILEPLVDILLFFVVLIAVFSGLKVWGNLRPSPPESDRAVPQLSCPEPDAVTILSHADPPLVMNDDMIAHLRRLLVRTRVRPTLWLAGVRLDARISLTTLRLRTMFRAIDSHGSLERQFLLSHLPRDCGTAYVVQFDSNE